MMSAIQLVASLAMLSLVAAKSVEKQQDEQVSVVIPSPNQEMGDDESSFVPDIRRIGESIKAEASNEAAVPVYVSPFVRSERAALGNFERQESSHAPPNYAPRPAASAVKDLKTSASYGHHHGHHGYDHSGWLDMGAWTGGKGSFGWYADYPVGGKHHYGYGKK